MKKIGKILIISLSMLLLSGCLSAKIKLAQEGAEYVDDQID